MARALQLSILGEILQYIHPKNYSDWGPELPNVRGSRGLLVSLNPQPLPPEPPPEIAAFLHRRPQVHDIAGLFLNRMLVQLDTLEYESRNEQGQAVQVMARQVDMLADWCGTIPRNERIRELLRKLRWRFPPIPEPDPHPEWQSLVITSALFAQAATIVGHDDLAKVLNRGAENILEVGLAQSGLQPQRELSSGSELAA